MPQIRLRRHRSTALPLVPLFSTETKPVSLFENGSTGCSRHAEYGVIYADPPWNFRTWSAKGTGRSAAEEGPNGPRFRRFRGMEEAATAPEGLDAMVDLSQRYRRCGHTLH
jgi:hypothetical protein